MDLTATSGVPATYTAEAATVNSQAAAKPDTTEESSFFICSEERGFFCGI